MRTARKLAVVVMPLLGSIATVPEADAQSAITGVVIDACDSRPVVGATVTLLSGVGAAVTEGVGAFRLTVTAGGRFIVEIRHLSYATRTDTIRLAEGENALVRIRLVEAALELPPIAVETRSFRLDDAGFFGRRERGIGTFPTRADMNAQNSGTSRMSSRARRGCVARCPPMAPPVSIPAAA